ncbi:hypothetical protein [Streptomyces sp. NPDC055085]
MSEIFCGYCDGSGLNEFVVGGIPDDEITAGARKRLAAHVARLIALVSAPVRGMAA